MSGSKKVVRRVKASTADDSKKTIASRRAKAIAKVQVAEKAAREESEASRKANTKKLKADQKRATARKKVASEKRETRAIAKPFIKLWKYLRDSWHELGKVEWPSRSATWRMTLSVIIFCLVVGAFVLLCDWASQWIIQEVIL